MIPKLRYLYQLYTHPKGALVRNCLAFSALMALAPSIALLSIASLLFLQDTLQLQTNLSSIIPEAIVEILIHAGVTSFSLGFFPFLLSIGISIFTASRGFYATIVSFRIFNQAKINPIIITIQSLFATILFIVLTILVIFFNTILHLIFPNLSYAFNLILSLFFFHLIGAAFFILTSNPMKRYSEIMYGSWTFGIGISLMGSLFFFYINQFTNYQDIYGSIAGFLILILAMYWLSCLIYFCFCVNEWVRLDRLHALNELFPSQTTFFQEDLWRISPDTKDDR